MCVTGSRCLSDVYMLHLSNGLRGRDGNKAQHCLSSEAKVSLGTRQGRSISQFSLSLSLSLFLPLRSYCLPRSEPRESLNVVFASPHCNLTLGHGRLDHFSTAQNEAEQQLSVD